MIFFLLKRWFGSNSLRMSELNFSIVDIFNILLSGLTYFVISLRAIIFHSIVRELLIFTERPTKPGAGRYIRPVIQ